MSSWFTEVNEGSDVNSTGHNAKAPESVRMYDEETERRSTQVAVASCFFEHIVERFPGSAMTQQTQPHTTSASSSRRAASSSPRAKVLSTNASQHADRHKKSAEGVVAAAAANYSEDDDSQPRVAAQHLPAPASRDARQHEQQQQQQQQQLPSTMQTCNRNSHTWGFIPDESFLCPIPITSRNVSRPTPHQHQQQQQPSHQGQTSPKPNNNNSNNTASANTTGAPAPPPPLRERYEMQIQTLEARDLLGAVVFADIVCLCGSGDRGRFLLLGSMPLFSSSPSVCPSLSPPPLAAAAEQKDKNPMPTGWRIIYFAPRCAHVRLRLVVLSSDCALLRGGHVEVAAFSSRQRVQRGGVRVTVPSVEEDFAQWQQQQRQQRTKSTSSSTTHTFFPSWWNVTAAGAESSVPLSFLRPVYLVDPDSGEQQLAVDGAGRHIVAGFEAASMVERAPLTVRGEQHASLMPQHHHHQHNNNENINSYIAARSEDQHAVSCCWIVAIRARKDNNNNNNNSQAVHVESFVRHLSIGVSWTISLAPSERQLEQMQDGGDGCCCCSNNSGGGSGERNKMSAASAQLRHRMTVISGESNRDQQGAARARWLWQTTPLAALEAAKMDLKSVPPEMWHSLRRRSSEVSPKSMTELLGINTVCY